MNDYVPQPKPQDEYIQDVLMTTKEVAEFLQISPSTMYRLIDTRKIAFYKVAGLIRISRRDVDTYLATHKIAPPARRL